MKVYIAGKITGDSDYQHKFEIVANEYQRQGHVVLNPAILPSGMLPADYMRICFAMIDAADIVVFLPDWEESGGAKVEFEYCHYICKPYKELGGVNT